MGGGAESVYGWTFNVFNVVLVISFCIIHHSCVGLGCCGGGESLATRQVYWLEFQFVAFYLQCNSLRDRLMYFDSGKTQACAEKRMPMTR